MKTKTRKTKGKVQHRRRVRFLCLDYYRTLVTGETTMIEGITTYRCDTNTIDVWFDNGMLRVYKVNEGEKQLKQVIKIINAYLGGTGDGTQQLFA